MWLMLQQDTPDDYVIATGVTHRVRDFVATAFTHVGIDDWQRHVEVDSRLFRPAEVDRLVGDSSKARQVLGWHQKVTFEELVSMMVESDLQRVSQESKHS